jgi:hypothetical protein
MSVDCSYKHFLGAQYEMNILCLPSPNSASLPFHLNQKRGTQNAGNMPTGICSWVDSRAGVSTCQNKHSKRYVLEIDNIVDDQWHKDHGKDRGGGCLRRESWKGMILDMENKDNKFHLFVHPKIWPLIASLYQLSSSLTLSCNDRVET